MELFIWSVIFIVALVVMIKGADWLLVSAEKIGLALGLSSFIVGVTIVGLGTSFPELVSSIVAVMADASEMVTANAIGSNIANILLVVGVSALIGRKVVMTKSLIDLDLPLLASATALFLGVAWDGTVTLVESIILLFAYAIYLAYTLIHEHDEPHNPESVAGTLPKKKQQSVARKKEKKLRPKLVFKDFVLLIFGIAGLVIGAKYVVESVIRISSILDIATGVIAISAVALGTSLPELLVSVKAAMRGKPEVALGNIFGSNIFNILVVVGASGLFGTLRIDATTFAIGLPALIVATLLFVISGISRRIHVWEGAFYIMLYVVFMGKLFSVL